MVADILPVLTILSNCSTSLLTSHFFCFGCLIWRAFASVKSSSSRPCFHKVKRRLTVLELDPVVSDLFWGAADAVESLLLHCDVRIWRVFYE